MPCMCGDTQCPSCGRAQGTYVEADDPFDLNEEDDFTEEEDDLENEPDPDEEEDYDE